MWQINIKFDVALVKRESISLLKKNWEKIPQRQFGI